VYQNGRWDSDFLTSRTLADTGAWATSPGSGRASNVATTVPATGGGNLVEFWDPRSGPLRLRRDLA
jgi:hypothetical protein